MQVTELEKLISEYGPIIYGFVYKLTQNRDDADDLYQQTLLKAFEMLDTIDSTRYPKTFIISLALSIYKNEKRKIFRREHIAPTIVITEENQNRFPSSDDVEQTLIQKELHEALSECIGLLDDKFRIPIILYYQSEFSVDEIASIMKKPTGTVKTRLKKARELLKTGMEEHGYGR